MILCALESGDAAAAEQLVEAIPELRPMHGFDQHSKYHKYDVWRHSLEATAAIRPERVLRWTMLFHDIAKPHCFSMDEAGEGHFYGHASLSAEMADEIMGRLDFSKEEREHIVLLVKHHDTPMSTEKQRLRRLINRFGGQTALELVEIHRADTAAQSERCAYRFEELEAVEAGIRELLAEREKFSLRDLALGGDDLLAKGYRGRDVGRALQRCMEAVRNGESENTREALLGLVQREKI